MTRYPKQKVYVDDKDVAIDVATSVANVVEEKTQAKVRMHRAKASGRVGPEHHGHASTAKARGRLERAKDAVAAKITATKREKARLRKKNKFSDRQNAQKDATASSGEPVDCNGSKSMKRVTFG